MAQAELLLDAETMNTTSLRFTQDSQRWRTRAWRVASFLARLTSVSLALFGLFRLSIDSWKFATRSGDLRSCACGSTVDEAIANGCKYDPIATAWLPDHCRDDELIEEFNHAGPGPNGEWTYYSDWNKTSTYTLEEVARLPDKHAYFFTTHEWHVKHCTYEWARQWRKTQLGTTIPKRSDSRGHIQHCEMMFLLRDPLQDLVTGSGVSLNADNVPKPHHDHGNAA